MARHTHPVARAKHAREHTRMQRTRYIERRWQRLKSGEMMNDYPYSCHYNGFEFGGFGGRSWWSEEEQEIAELVSACGPVVFVDSESARRLPARLRESLDWTLNERLNGLANRLSHRGHDWDGECFAERYPRAYWKRAWQIEADGEIAELELLDELAGKWLRIRHSGIFCTTAICHCMGCDGRYEEEMIWEEWCDGEPQEGVGFRRWRPQPRRRS